MRILFIVPYFPTRIRTRPFNLIRALAAEGHSLTVLTVAGDATELEEAVALRSRAIRVIAVPLGRIRPLVNIAQAMATGEPLQAAYCWHPGLAKTLQTLLGDETFDVIHVEHLRGARYGLLAKKVVDGIGATTPIVWDSVDCISHLFRQASRQSSARFNRMVTRFELPRTEQYESRLVSGFDRVLTTSPVDRDALSDLAVGHGRIPSPIHVLPNGVDLVAFQPDPSVTREPATLILSGKMSYHANVTMAVSLVRDVMPLVWSVRSDVRLTIVGQDPAPAVLVLGADPRITVTGAVPDIQPHLARATLAVAPIVYSAGIQNKILEAMACGTAVITTSAALGGLMASPGIDLLVEDSDQAFASAVISLLESDHKREAIARAGRAYVVTNHNWSKVGKDLSALYQEVQQEGARAFCLPAFDKKMVSLGEV